MTELCKFLPNISQPTYRLSSFLHFCPFPRALMNLINHIVTSLAKWLNIGLLALFRGMPECMFGPGPIHTVGLKHMLKAKHMRKCSAEQNWGCMVGFISTNLLCCPPYHHVKSLILCFSFFKFHCFFHSTISVLTSILLCFQNNGLHKQS